jgi:hypothetical protein
MRKIVDKIGAWFPFALWVLMALLALSALVCCAAQAACGFGQFWAICGAVGAGLSVLIYGWQAYGEILEMKEGEE